MVGSLFTDDVGFTTEEWQRIIINPLDGKTFEGKMMLCLASAPALIKRARHCADSPDFDLTEAAEGGYAQIKLILSDLRARRHLAGKPHLLGAPDLYSHGLGVVLYERAYCFGLAIAFVYNSLVTFVTSDTLRLQLEANSFAMELLDFIPSARRYQPLGGAFMTLCLRIALISEVDLETKSLISQNLFEFQGDFHFEGQKWIPDAMQKRFRRPIPLH